MAPQKRRFAGGLPGKSSRLKTNASDALWLHQLPRELRNIIYGYVLCANCPQLLKAPAKGRTKLAQITRPPCMDILGQKIVLYSTSPVSRISRNTRNEFLEAVVNLAPRFVATVVDFDFEPVIDLVCKLKSITRPRHVALYFRFTSGISSVKSFKEWVKFYTSHQNDTEMAAKIVVLIKPYHSPGLATRHRALAACGMVEHLIAGDKNCDLDLGIVEQMFTAVQGKSGPDPLVTQDGLSYHGASISEREADACDGNERHWAGPLSQSGNHVVSNSASMSSIVDQVATSLREHQDLFPWTTQSSSMQLLRDFFHGIGMGSERNLGALE